MLKLLNRFAWILSILIWIQISWLFWFYYVWNFWNIIVWAIIWIFIKKLLLSENYLNERLEFFADSIKRNYIWNENSSISNKSNSPIIPLNKIEKNIEEKEIPIDLEKFEEKTEINTNFNTTNSLKSDTENNTFQVEDLENSKNYTQAKYVPNAFDIFFEKTWTYIKEFFSTNLLAKLGWILVFLAVVYLLKWVFLNMGPVAKLILWIFVGFWIYGTWVKIHWKYENEGLILMWIWILINFAVILSWRYLVWDWGYLTEGTTFLFLILNTVFGVLTSLIYKSRTLLIFSFIFAYLNPFIIWAQPNWEPYTLIWYSLIVSLWALFLSQKNNSIILFIISFIFWNILLFIAPTSDTSWEMTKLIALNFFNIIAIYNSIKFSDKYKLIIELTFAWVFFIIWWFIVNITSNSSTIYLLAILSSLIFLFYSYFLSKKKSYLFPIWTIWTILTLAPLIVNNYQFAEGLQNSAPSNILQFNLSVLAIIIFAIINLVLPFINKKLFEKHNLSNLVIWSLAWAWFFAFQIYNYWEIHFSWLTEWLWFLGLAIIYFIQSYLMISKLWIENVKNDDNLKNIFYTFIWISISLFSIAMAFIFSNYPEIITTIWLFEATILYFFYSQTSSQKIFWAASVLFIIGLTKFWILLDIVHRWDFKFLISFVIILASFILNLFFINKAKENNSHNFHHFFHLIWMAIMWWLLLEIIPSTWHGWSMLWISIFITILWYFYSKFNFNFLKISFLVIIWLFSALHIWELHSIFYLLEKDNLEYLKIMQYVVSGIIISSYLIWNKFNKNKNYNKTLLIIIAIYSFIISNLYVLDLFENIFGYYTLTIYWGLIASALLIYWIQKDIIKYRTIWLYFLTLTSLKIFLYDVWQIWDTNSRVIVFAVLWVIFIVISTFYSKRFWDNMKWEFSLDNLKSENNSTKNSKTKSPKISSNEKNTNKKDTNNKYKKEESNLEKKEFIINKNIKKIKVWDTKSVQFIFNNNEKISIRATNLIKIVKLVIKELDWKTIYKKDELSSIYEYVKDNYKSEISKDNYNKIIKILERFVKEWWEIKLK